MSNSLLGMCARVQDANMLVPYADVHVRMLVAMAIKLEL